jgi:hypothetical protein
MLADLSRSRTAKGLAAGLGIAGAAVSLASGVNSLSKGLSDDLRFTVVYNTVNGPQKMTLKAADKISAKHKIQSKVNGQDFRVFQVPQENDEALEYFDHLKSQQ